MLDSGSPTSEWRRSGWSPQTHAHSISPSHPESRSVNSSHPEKNSGTGIIDWIRSISPTCINPQCRIHPITPLNEIKQVNPYPVHSVYVL